MATYLHSTTPCSRCARGSYRPEMSSATSCFPCPANSYTSRSSLAGAKTACVCNAGFRYACPKGPVNSVKSPTLLKKRPTDKAYLRGAPGEACVNPNATLPPPPPSTTPAAAVPVGAAVVVVEVRLPMTESQFREQEASFKAALAAAAGPSVMASDVEITSVTEASARRGGAAGMRRGGAGGEVLQVSSSVKGGGGAAGMG